MDVRKNAFYALSIDDVLFSSDKILKELKEDPFEEKLKLWNFPVTFFGLLNKQSNNHTKTTHLLFLEEEKHWIEHTHIYYTLVWFNKACLDNNLVK